jgi:hypothetical protein
VNAGQDVEMSLNHPDLKDVGSLLSGHGPKKSAEERRELTVYEPLAIPCGPDQVDIEAVSHGIA